MLLLGFMQHSLGQVDAPGVGRSIMNFVGTRPLIWLGSLLHQEFINI